MCARGIPSSPYASLYGALVCGIDVQGGFEKALFLDTGLIHILVVSGAHLVFVERLCVRLPHTPRLAVTGVYCWLTGLGAPVVRAFVRRLCEPRLRGWGWSSLQVEAAATMAILLVNPPWLFSRSFLMSWLCALALQAPWRVPRWPQLTASVKCYAFLFPFAPSSPLAIAWNCILGPFIGAILFPACLAAFALPWIVPACDWIWFSVLWLLEQGPRAGPAEIWFPTTWIWWLPSAVHLALLIGEWKWRRAVAFSC